MLVAAGQLLTERVPSDIAGRHITDRAGVQYGLLHRHFESKHHLLEQALETMVADFLTDHRSVDGAVALVGNPGLCRAVAHMILDPHHDGDQRLALPLLEHIRLRLSDTRRGLDDQQRAAVAAVALTTAIGVSVNASVIASGVGVSAGDRRIERYLCRWLGGLAAGTGPLGGTPSFDDAPPVAGGPRPAAWSTSDRDPDAPPDERLVMAGAALLAERVPSSISGRELARLADVNYGLIHYYFGSKDEVLRRSVQLHRNRFVTEMAKQGRLPLFFSVCEHPGYVRAMAWSVLDPRLISEEHRYPVSSGIADRLAARFDSSESRAVARIAVLVTVAAQIAWALMLPLIEEANGADPRTIEPLAAALLRELLVDPLGE